MLQFILYWILLCTNPAHQHNSQCYTLVMTTNGEDTGGENGNTPPPPPPPPPPPRN